MNPLDMMKFSGLWSTFTANHPKFPKFIAAASRKGVLAEGSIIAMQITTPDGETLETNLKVTASDLELIQQIKKMGNLKDLASMIPGVGKAIKDIDIDDNAFKSIEAIIYSMTPAERSNPALLNGSRRQRIAKGSGTNIQEVNRLLKQFDQTRKMMKMVTGSKMGKMMPKMKR